MKKYFTVCVVMVCLVTSSLSTPVYAAGSNNDAKAMLIQQLTLKLNELIKELTIILVKQDNVIKGEVSMSRVNADLYFDLYQKNSYMGACVDMIDRIKNSIAVKKVGMTIKDSNIACFASSNNYALSIKTSKGYSCADSTGIMRDTTGPTIKTACPVK